MEYLGKTKNTCFRSKLNTTNKPSIALAKYCIDFTRIKTQYIDITRAKNYPSEAIQLTQTQTTCHKRNLEHAKCPNVGENNSELSKMLHRSKREKTASVN